MISILNHQKRKRVIKIVAAARRRELTARNRFVPFVSETNVLGLVAVGFAERSGHIRRDFTTYLPWHDAAKLALVLLWKSVVAWWEA